MILRAADPKAAVALCEDVVAQIESRRFIPQSHATYFSSPSPDTVEFHNRWVEDKLTAADLKGLASCSVCAKGALTVAYFLDQPDEAAVGNIYHVANAFNGTPLEPVFGRPMLEAVEDLFEGYGNEDNLPGGADGKPIKATFPDDGERLREIMSHIALNRGKLDTEAWHE